ncbi:hypothetical protein PENANT_c011G07635 [Penicillium antarcticum]|uniref:Protein kinase domain-containing protein n=1 Tax=Penicillium antarcticum TaxID=416450 RepID=A0A1V6Q6S3_9EURO|nr:uncharacterized protein N7508_002962 [Penicillium antarcticum]KAJ5312132.1 hypothetical protein N7508_002962 [Penicillium antarcticum]OQD84921.1 hypothetical protein PENANT_c011G07635 [Penicillium antarcticum]
MDFYGTAVTAITQVYQVTVFIQGVISDVKAFDDDRAEIRLKLNVQLSTLIFFKRTFFHLEHGLMIPGKVDPFIAETVEGLLVQMRKTLAEYEIMASKYGLVDEEYTIEPEKPKEQESLLERAKSKAKSLKLKGYDWSLFDKKKLNHILEAYTKWSEDLRNLMQHMSQETLAKLAEGDQQGLKSSGLEPVMKRRLLAESKAPADYQSLTGTVTEEGNSTGGFKLGKWSVSKSEETQVIVEYHEYESLLRQEDEPEEIKALKEPIRNLAWLLQNTTFSSTSSDFLDQPKIYALECLGFIDQPTEERSVFLYKLPSEPTGPASLTTLHAFINAIDSTNKRPVKKPSLNDRFSMAHSLALTISNVHASAWVHKNIWSRGILLFLETSTGASTSGLYEHRLSAPTIGQKIVSYLSDWGYARSVQQGTDMRSDFEVEPNFYRHPTRQGRPTQQFSRLHDIYALGVVLLEIGLWITVSRLMGPKIKEAEASGKLPRPKKISEELMMFALQGLPKEMGAGYTRAVIACLKGDFRGTEGPALAVDFQEKVVDVLAKGVEL